MPPPGLNTPLNASQVTIADFPSGMNVVRLDIDPRVYNPFNVPIRGSSGPVLDGTVVHQVFGLQQEDFQIELQGQITAYATMKSLWSKYRQGGGGQTFLFTDWYNNSFEVVFTPGATSFHPVYLLGTADSFDYTMGFRVISIVAWFGGTY